MSPSILSIKKPYIAVFIICVKSDFTLILASSGPFVDSWILLPCFSLCLYVFMTPQRNALLFYKHIHIHTTKTRHKSTPNFLTTSAHDNPFKPLALKRSITLNDSNPCCFEQATVPICVLTNIQMVCESHLHVGQVALFKLLQYRECPLFIKLPQRIDGSLVQVSVRYKA